MGQIWPAIGFYVARGHTGYYLHPFRQQFLRQNVAPVRKSLGDGPGLAGKITVYGFPGER